MGSQLSVKLFSSAANSLEIISVLVERSCPNLMNTGPRLSNVFLKFCSILFFELKVFKNGLKPFMKVLKIPVFLKTAKIFNKRIMVIFFLYEGTQYH